MHLCLFPEMGRNVELARTSGVIRDFAFGNCTVRYALHTEAVAILAYGSCALNQNTAWRGKPQQSAFLSAFVPLLIAWIIQITATVHNG